MRWRFSYWRVEQIAGADGKQKQVSETSPKKVLDHVDGGFCLYIFLMTIISKIMGTCCFVGVENCNLTGM